MLTQETVACLRQHLLHVYVNTYCMFTSTLVACLRQHLLHVYVNTYCMFICLCCAVTITPYMPRSELTSMAVAVDFIDLIGLSLPMYQTS